LCTSVVAKMNFTCGGGSSSVLSNAFHAVVGEHVDLVHDEDLEAVALRAGTAASPADADVVDAVVAGAVDLLHVDVDARGDLLARRALRGTASRWGPSRS
jgi:hypothetical protein